MAYYDQLVKQLAVAVKRKQRSLPAAKIGGYIVNTCGWVKGEGYILIYKK
jgi:polynucleotide 5'-kinase involved in rRNA processing